MIQMYHGIVPTGGTVSLQVDTDCAVGVCADPHNGATLLNLQVDLTLVQQVPAGNIGTLNMVAGQTLSISPSAAAAAGYVAAFEAEGSIVATVV